jgi:hypothetical protein
MIGKPTLTGTDDQVEGVGEDVEKLAPVSLFEGAQQ